MIVLIDNYDSFVYNLARYVKELGHECTVVRNDQITAEEIIKLYAPTHIIISPGPCTPKESGVSLGVIEKLGQHLPILGVCLGHQAIGHVFGAAIIRAERPMHGKASLIWHTQTGLFENLENPLSVARYHSLIVAENNFPDVLSIDARSVEGEVMALHHKYLPIYGVQFHPESILTEGGYALLKRFLDTRI